MPGFVTHVFTASEQGAPVRSHDEIHAIAGVGLEGDRYAKHRGRYSDGPSHGRHLTLVAQEGIDAANAQLATPLEPGDVRRNIVTTGIDLDTLIGHRFRIGTVVCEAVRPCPPCTYLDGLLGQRAIDALRGRAGIRADIVADGTIRVGDRVERIEREPASAAQPAQGVNDSTDGSGL
jgi:MOSC domain-containing protein YiiM